MRPARTAKVWILGGVLVAACTAPGADRQRPSDEWRGWLLDEPVAKADFRLTATDGATFSFQQDTEGYVTLLFFGYTSCPDVCPLHLANLGAVIRKLPPGVASRIKVVFVTTDPERDTPERVREWLDNFDPAFIGLVGDLDEVNRIQSLFGLGAAYREDWPEGGYGVAHAGQVLAFTPDGYAHLAYPFGIRQQDWAADLPRLVTHGVQREAP